MSTTKWRNVMHQDIVEGYRKGWLGVWDHFWAQLRGQPRASIEMRVTMQARVRGNADLKFVVEPPTCMVTPAADKNTELRLGDNIGVKEGMEEWKRREKIV